MKKLMYLFVAGAMFAFTACGGGETATEEVVEEAVQEVVEEVVEEVAVEDTAVAEETEVTEEVAD